MIRHIVAWKLKAQAEGNTCAENALKIKEGLMGLQGVIPEIIDIEVGINEVPSEQAADIVLTVTFDSLEAMDRYQKHPEHENVAGFIGKVRETRTVVDYTVD